MLVYIDKNYKCHITPSEDTTPVDVVYFDNKCQTFIEGYRFIPEGENLTREDGTVFSGEMVAPWKPYKELDASQRKYEHEQLKALNILLGEEG